MSRRFLSLVSVLGALAPGFFACSKVREVPESTRSAPPDATPYVRPAIPEDSAPFGKPAIAPGTVKEDQVDTKKSPSPGAQER